VGKEFIITNWHLYLWKIFHPTPIIIPSPLKTT
jgi:hypothetical protein